MIYCTKCGTENAARTRFCNGCGAPLIHTGQLCPDCGTRNPVGTVFCDNCNARLVPPTGIQDMDAEPGAEEEPPRAPIKGLSLPTIPLGEDSATEKEDAAPADEEAWLSDLRASVDEETVGQPRMEEVEPSGVVQDPTAEAPEPSGDPDWLKQLQAETPPLTVDDILAEASPAAVATPEGITPTEGDGLPDWLQGLGTAAPPSPEAELPAADSGAPEWLTEPSAAPIPEREVEAQADDAATPDWLEGLDAAPVPTADAELPVAAGAPLEPPSDVAAAPEPAPDAKAPPALTGTTDWLQSLADEQASPPATGVLPGTGTLPEWLERLGTGPLPIMPTGAEGGPPVPDWLQSSKAFRRGDTGPLEPAVVEQAETVRVPPSEDTPIPVEPGDLPDWLTEMRPTAEGEQPPARAEPDAQPIAAPPDGILPGGLAPAEIPEWMQALRPGAEVAAPDEPPETEGLLQGMRGTLLPSPAIDETGQLSSAPSLTSAASIARAQLLQELLSRSAEQPQVEEQRRRAKLGWTLQRLLVSLLFIAAIVAPMTGAQMYDSDAAIPTTGLYADSVGVYDLIEAQVQSGDSVMVAFAFDASSADEMNRVAEPVVLHLLERGARLVPVSTLPEGPALAAGLIAGLSGDTQVSGVAAPVYQPGQAAGVQTLLSDASDLSMVVVLAGERGEFRTWLEQVRAKSVDLPVVAGISARVEPDARPYLSTGSNLRGIVVGLIGAAAYESTLGTTYRPASFYLQSLAVSHLVAVGLMILGGVVFMIGGKRR